MREPIGVNKG